MSDPYGDANQEPSTRVFDTDPYAGPDLTSAAERTTLGGPAKRQDRGCLHMALWGGAIVLAVLFVLSVPAVLFMFNMERIALNPETYKQALLRVDFYEQFPGLVGGVFSESITRSPEENQALANLTKADIQAIATRLVTKDWAQEQTESVIDQGFAWLESDDPTLSLKVSTSDIKKQLSGPEGETIALTVINSWPPCTETEVFAATAAVALGDTSQMPVCRPPDELMPSVAPYFSGLVAQGANNIPDTLDLAAPNGLSQPISPANDPRPALKTYRAIGFFSPIVPMLLLLGIALFVVRSWKSLGLWWGVPLLISGILGGILALLMLPLRSAITQSLTSSSESIPASFQNIFTGVIGYVFETAGWWIGGESGVLVVGGGMLIVLGYVMARDEPKSGSLTYS